MSARGEVGCLVMMVADLSSSSRDSAFAVETVAASSVCVHCPALPQPSSRCLCVFVLCGAIHTRSPLFQTPLCLLSLRCASRVALQLVSRMAWPPYACHEVHCTTWWAGQEALWTASHSDRGLRRR